MKDLGGSDTEFAAKHTLRRKLNSIYQKLGRKCRLFVSIIVLNRLHLSHSKSSAFMRSVTPKSRSSTPIALSLVSSQSWHATTNQLVSLPPPLLILHINPIPIHITYFVHAFHFNHSTSRSLFLDIKIWITPSRHAVKFSKLLFILCNHSINHWIKWVNSLSCRVVVCSLALFFFEFYIFNFTEKKNWASGDDKIFHFGSSRDNATQSENFFRWYSSLTVWYIKFNHSLQSSFQVLRMAERSWIALRNGGIYGKNFYCLLSKARWDTFMFLCTTNLWKNTQKM